MTSFTIKGPIEEAPPAAWPEQITHLSATSLGMFKRCPEQYRRRYLLGEKAPPSANMIWGKSDHAAISHDLAYKIEHGENLDMDTVLDVASEDWKGQVDEVGGPGEIDYGIHAKDLGDMPSPGDLSLLDERLRNEMLRLVGLYHHQVSQRIQPVAVEEEFSITVPNVPVPLVGYIDIVEKKQIRERKTAAKMERTVKGDWAAQGRVYQLFRPLPVTWDVSLKQVKPTVKEEAYIQAYNKKIAEASGVSVAMTGAQIVFLIEKYGLEHPWPDALTHSWACNYCGWRPDCYWHTGKGA